MSQQTPVQTLEHFLTARERTFIGLCAAVLLQEKFLECLPQSSQHFIDKNDDDILQLACWTVNPEVSGIAENSSADAFIIETIKLAISRNTARGLEYVVVDDQGKIRCNKPKDVVQDNYRR